MSTVSKQEMSLIFTIKKKEEFKKKILCLRISLKWCYDSDFRRPAVKKKTKKGTT